MPACKEKRITEPWTNRRRLVEINLGSEGWTNSRSDRWTIGGYNGWTNGGNDGLTHEERQMRVPTDGPTDRHTREVAAHD